MSSIALSRRDLIVSWNSPPSRVGCCRDTASSASGHTYLESQTVRQSDSHTIAKVEENSRQRQEKNKKRKQDFRQLFILEPLMHRLPSSGAGCAYGPIAHLSHMNASVDVMQNAAEIVHVAVLSTHIASGISTAVNQHENPRKLSACLYHEPCCSGSFQISELVACFASHCLACRPGSVPSSSIVSSLRVTPHACGGVWSLQIP